MTNIHVIYHANCLDGFASAWVFNLRFPDRLMEGFPISYHALNYGDPLPDDIKMGDMVWFLDFSLKYSEMFALLTSGCHVRVFDHHKTAVAELEPLRHLFKPDQLRMVLDTERTGCMITWNECFPGRDPNGIVHHINDRDMWKFQVNCTKEICAALESIPRNFTSWNCTTLQQLYRKGEAILAYQNFQIEKMCANATRQSIGEHVVWTVNTAILQSEVCHRLLELHPEAHFVAAYFDVPVPEHPPDLCWGFLKRVVSLRSRGDFDVSELARRFNGGGHKAAAGFSMKLNHFGLFPSATRATE